MAITVAYEVLADGYTVTGGLNEPIRATVPYRVNWSDAFTFYDQVMGYPTSPTQGATIVQNAPHRFPATVAPIYASRAQISPIGAPAATSSASTPANKGLSPGEHFTKAIVTVVYEPLPFDVDPSQDDPAGVNQLDPANPITYCEQEVDAGGKMTTIKGSGYEFDDGTPVTSDFAKVDVESKIVLTFPRIPYLPWQKVQPYIGKVNSLAMLGCAAGTLLLENAKIKFSATSQGRKGTSYQLIFLFQPEDWNKLPKPNGTLALVRKKGATSTRIYGTADFRAIFLGL